MLKRSLWVAPAVVAVLERWRVAPYMKSSSMRGASMIMPSLKKDWGCEMRGNRSIWISDGGGGGEREGDGVGGK